MKSLVLLSGGIDSTVALAEALDRGADCQALTFYYGQSNWPGEIDAAVAVANHYGVPLTQCHIDGQFWRGTSFLTGGSTDPLQSYVPARNLLFLAHGIAYAEAQGMDDIWFGPNADDAGFYPDCRYIFVEAANRVAALGTKRHVHIIAPHLERTKVQVIQRGLALGAPLGLTTSCAAGHPECGVCRGCVLKRDAYVALGLHGART